MKPDVQAKPSKNPAPVVVPEEPPLFSAEGFRRNRRLFIGIGVGIGAVLIVGAGIALSNYWTASANEKAWASYANVRPGLAAATPPPASPRTPSDTARDVESVLPSIKNTSAEPWALYDLGNAYFAMNEPQKARDVFNDLKARYPSHTLVHKPNSTSTVDAAIQDCDKEIDWNKSHPRPQPKPATPPATGASTGSAPADGTAPKDTETKK